MDWAVTARLGAVDGISARMARASTSVEGFGRRAAAAFGLANREGGLFRKLVGAQIVSNLATRGIRLLATEIKNLVGGGMQLASNLVEVQNVVDTTFGANAAAVDKWAMTTAAAYGISELQAKQYSSTLGAMMKSSGLTGASMLDMSTKLSGLVGDFASFYNLDHEVAFQKIRAGISGETEPLKQLGINMSVANMEAFALASGIRKHWKDMSQGEQTILRYNFLMKSSADAQGDFAKTSETSLANQQRIFEMLKMQTASRFMGALLPLALRLQTRLNGIVERVGAWVEANREVIASKIEAFVERVVSWLTRMGRWYQDNKAQIAAVWNTVMGAMRWIGEHAGLVLGLAAAWKGVTIALGIARAAQAAFNLTAAAAPAASALATGGAAAAGGLGPAAQALMGGGAATATGGAAALGGMGLLPLAGGVALLGGHVLNTVANPNAQINRARALNRGEGGRGGIGGLLDRAQALGMRLGGVSSRDPEAPNAYAAAVQQRQADSMQSVLEGNVNFSVNTQATPGVGVQIRRAPPVTSPTLRQYTGGR